MHTITKKRQRYVAVSAAALLLGLSGIAQAAIPPENAQGAPTDNAAAGNAASNQEAAAPQVMVSDPALNDSVKATLAYCQENYAACARMTGHAAGILVFPSVIRADLLVGGSGGKGALIENGKITGYYYIGAGSVGAQIGVDKASQVYVFPNEQAMQQLKNGASYWRVGGDLGVTVMAADVNVRDVTGKTVAFIFNSQGLQAGVSADLFDIWKFGTARPEPVGQG